jgi:hypothetical protein
MASNTVDHAADVAIQSLLADLALVGKQEFP